jgi:5-methylcytosine-specific restriction endonuclease McrA
MYNNNVAFFFLDTLQELGLDSEFSVIEHQLYRILAGDFNEMNLNTLCRRFILKRFSRPSQDVGRFWTKF